MNINPERLLAHLEEMYPDKLPMGATVDIEHLKRLQGQRSVVEYIKHLFNSDPTMENL